jgi:hypothetical protein
VSDPHVVALRYRFVSVNENDRFNSAAPMTLTADGFDLRLAGGILEATPQAHFATAAEARGAIEPFLASWAAQARLERPRRQIRFDFDEAEVIDRIPDGVVVRPPAARIQMFTGNAVIVVDNSTYPAPPVDFRTDPVLDAILGRLGELDAGRATLTDTANWALTKIEAAFGGPRGARNRRATASRALGVDAIPATLGRLASQNDPEIGRKATGPEVPLTANEKAWMRAAIVLIARRIGTRTAGGVPTPMSMGDLPPIP